MKINNYIFKLDYTLSVVSSGKLVITFTYHSSSLQLN